MPSAATKELLTSPALLNLLAAAPAACMWALYVSVTKTALSVDRVLEPGEEIRVFPVAYLVEGVLPARREASDDYVVTESQTEGGEVEGLCCVDRHVDGREFRLVLGCARVGEAGPCYL